MTSLASILRGAEPIEKGRGKAGKGGGKQRRYPAGHPRGGQFMDMPDQPRRPVARRGRLTDLNAAELAAQRASAKEKDRPLKPGDTWATNPKGWAKATFEGAFPGGWSTRVRSVGEDRHKSERVIIVRGQILRFGRVSGEFTRRVFLDSDTIEHSLFKLDPQYQGGGFGKQFLHQSEDAYLRAGLKRITLNANIDIGGYAWSRYGFAFDGPSEAEDYARHLQRLTLETKRGRHPSVPTYDGWENDVKKVIAKRGKMTPQDVAEIGIEHAVEDEYGYKQWTGKQLMIISDGWNGVKPVQQREDRAY